MSFWSASKSRRRAPSPDTEDMFFDTATNFPRSNLAERLGNSVFDDFPTRRSAAAMRSFPSHAADPMPFGGSLPRHQRHHAPSWLSSEDFVDSRESSPLSDAAQRIPRHPTFQRTDSNPSRATPPASRQDSRHGSRSSTPESTGSGHSHRSRTSTGTDDGAGGHAEETMEEHPGVTARNGRPSFTARRQPKVHHIPITVEPRDGSSTPVVLTPPVDNASNDVGSFHHHTQQQQKAPSESPPVTRCSSQTVPEDGNAFSSSSPQSSTSPATNQTKTVPSPPVTTTAKKPPFRAKAKAASTASGGPTKPVVPEPVFPTAKPAAAPEPEPPKPAAVRKTPLDAVNDVLEDVAKLREVVAQFAGAKGDKHYLYLDEMLTRNLIRLDNISTEGNDDVRQARRGAVLAINDCLGLLDSQAAAATATASATLNAEATTAPESAANLSMTEETQGVVKDVDVTDDKPIAAPVKEEPSKDEMQQEPDGLPSSAMDEECTIVVGGAEANASAAADSVVDVASMDTDEGASQVGPEVLVVPVTESAEKSEAVTTVEVVN